MWLSKILGRVLLVFLRKKKETEINFDNYKYFIRKLFKNSIKQTKNKLTLACILSAVVYKYEDVDIEVTMPEKCDILEQGENDKPQVAVDRAENFNLTCASWDLNADRCGIYNIDDDTLVFGLFYINDTLVVSFKGSSSLKDFVSDLDIKTVNFTHKEVNLMGVTTEKEIKIQGKVHCGAYQILFENDRYKFILEKMGEYKNYRNIIITGHSLGGLLGSIFYVFLSKYYDDKTNMELVTFGAPRAGDSTFCTNILPTKHTRVVNNNDIIPKVPLPINYSHSGLLFHVGDVPISNWWFDIASSIDDHHIMSYYKNVLEIQ